MAQSGAKVKEEEDSHCRGTVLERVLHVNISNSLGNLALAGPHGGFWKPVDGTQFQILGQAMEGMDASAATHQLSSAMTH